MWHVWIGAGLRVAIGWIVGTWVLVAGVAWGLSHALQRVPGTASWRLPPRLVREAALLGGTALGLWVGLHLGLAHGLLAFGDAVGGLGSPPSAVDATWGAHWARIASLVAASLPHGRWVGVLIGHVIFGHWYLPALILQPLLGAMRTAADVPTVWVVARPTLADLVDQVTLIWGVILVGLAAGSAVVLTGLVLHDRGMSARHRRHLADHARTQTAAVSPTGEAAPERPDASASGGRSR